MIAPAVRGRVLIVEDEVALGRMVGMVLREHDLVMAVDIDQALAALRESPVDVVVLDLMLPDGSGFDVLARVRETDLGAAPRIIVVSALGDEETRVRALEMGADDFVGKPFSPAELRARVLNVLGRQVQMQRLRARVDDLADLAWTDLLTGVANRGAFDLAVERMWRRATVDHTLALVTFDLDQFKLVNDQLGHPAGDRVLAAAARALATGCRAGEQLYRVGGDEFALLLWGGRGTARGAAVRLPPASTGCRPRPAPRWSGARRASPSVPPTTSSMSRTCGRQRMSTCTAPSARGWADPARHRPAGLIRSPVT